MNWQRVIRENPVDHSGELTLEWDKDDGTVADGSLVWTADGGGCTITLSGYNGDLHRLRDALSELIEASGVETSRGWHAP